MKYLTKEGSYQSCYCLGQWPNHIKHLVLWQWHTNLSYVIPCHGIPNLPIPPHITQHIAPWMALCFVNKLKGSGLGATTPGAPWRWIWWWSQPAAIRPSLQASINPSTALASLASLTARFLAALIAWSVEVQTFETEKMQTTLRWSTSNTHPSVSSTLC